MGRNVGGLYGKRKNNKITSPSYFTFRENNCEKAYFMKSHEKEESFSENSIHLKKIRKR